MTRAIRWTESKFFLVFFRQSTLYSCGHHPSSNRAGNLERHLIPRVGATRAQDRGAVRGTVEELRQTILAGLAEESFRAGNTENASAHGKRIAASNASEVKIDLESRVATKVACTEQIGG